jgi:hypothetical protein
MRLLHSLAFIASLVLPLAVHAQHEGHGGHFMPDGTFMLDTAMNHEHEERDHGEILGEPLGSGTAWLPAGSPVHAHAFHFNAGAWMFMTHGELVGRYTGQNLNNPDRWPPPPSATAGQSLYPEGERGGTNLDLPNWAMISAERGVFGRDRLMLRAMLSLDPLTIGRQGYPLLFQTGEGLADRQHAHDLFMELALLYVHPLSENNQLFAYFGLPGEPALGPAAFMHRPSAGGNPEAPLGHHFQDATHITHGVATAGWIHRRFKAEVSAFRGREPDADRWNIDVGALDSWSVRLTQNVGSHALQGSVARIRSPEPDEHPDITRTTISIARNRKLRLGGPVNWASTFAWGANAGHQSTPAHSFLKESALEGPRWALWNRFEALQRTGDELDLPSADVLSREWVTTLTLGAGGTVYRGAGLDFFLGGQAAANFTGSLLAEYYGSVPLSAQVFIKVRPSGPKI